MRSKSDKTTAITTDRSVINHEFLVTADTNVIGIYRRDGKLSIYLESADKIAKYEIDRGDSFNTKILPDTLAASWTKEELVRNVAHMEMIRGLRRTSDDVNEIQVTSDELQHFQGVLAVGATDSQTESEVNKVLQDALGELTQHVDMHYRPSQQMSYCNIM